MGLVRARVHVAPVGYEVDRIVMPARELKAERVWLLVHSKPGEDKAAATIERVAGALEGDGIDVVRESHDRHDLYGMVRAIRGILGKEEGNDVFVNLASGSKIQAVAGMMASMMFGGGAVTPFYAEAQSYAGFEGTQVSTGIKEIVRVPSYEIQVPEERLVRAMAAIAEGGGSVTKKALAEALDRQGVISVGSTGDNYAQVRFATLDKGIIRPLESKWGFVEVKKVGRNRWVSLTEEGRSAAKFLL